MIVSSSGCSSSITAVIVLSVFVCVNVVADVAVVFEAVVVTVVLLALAFVPVRSWRRSWKYRSSTRLQAM